MNSIWNKNYQSFKKRFPQLAQMVQEPSESDCIVPEWQISEAKNKQLTVTENGLRLHSGYNPQREASSAVADAQVQSKGTTVFYGFGAGYHLIEWAKLYGNQKKLIIIEPNLRRFFAAMTILDWTDVFAVEQLVLAVGCPVESVLPLIENADTVNIGESGVSDAFYFDIPAFQQHAQGYFETVKTIIKRNQRKNEINAATLKKFGKLWCRNSKRNLNQMEKRSGLSCYKNKADKDLPFLILGAGPSLEKVLPHLKELKEKCVIICVETALRAMLRYDVEPDFIILTDPQFWAYKHIAGLKALSSVLITEISAYPAVFRFPCKEVKLCASQFPVGQYYERKFALNLGDLGTGGSVASSAWNFAFYCGARKIYTAGLDFAFPGKQTHIRGSSAEQTYHTVGNRLASSDKFTSGALYSANAVMSKNYKGEPVLTDSRMKMFSWWFESRLASCADVETYTFSPEGLNTPGIHPEDLQNFLQTSQLVTEMKRQFLTAQSSPENKSDIKIQFSASEMAEKFPFLQSYL